MVKAYEKTILGLRKPPILLLGSGISRRYSSDAPCWMELLDRIGQRMGLSKAEMGPIKNDAEWNCDRSTGMMPRVATELRIELNKRLRSGKLRIEDIFSEEEVGYYLDHPNEAIKMMAAKECSGLKVDTDTELQAEIDCLRRLPDVIPCVITTNYDTIIENDLFGGRFKTYSKVSDYYLSGAQGIGEVYKIHGTCTDPSTIVLDEEDYGRFRRGARIVSAKILSVLCDYPMVIMGYSANDDDVKGILNDLISSLDDEKLREVERNIVFVEYDPSEPTFRYAVREMEYEGHAMSFKSLRTNDFLSIFEEIASMEASMSPETIRKVRQLVRKIQIGDESVNNRLKIIGIDDITSEDANKLVVMITNRDNLKALESVPSLSVDAMIRDILGITQPAGKPEEIVNLFASYGPQLYDDDEYVPIFHYLNKVERIPDNTYIRRFTEDKETQFRKIYNR